MERIKISLVDTSKMALICIAAYPAGLILMLLLGGNADLAISLPIISGFIHQSLSHFFFNILLLFFLLIYKGNSYNIKQMVAILVVIQTLCFILTFFGVPTSIGISGLVYFLMTRFLIGFKKILIPLIVIKPNSLIKISADIISDGSLSFKLLFKISISAFKF